MGPPNLHFLARSIYQHQVVVSKISYDCSRNIPISFQLLMFSKNAITFWNQQLSINGLSWVFPMKRLLFLWPHHVKVSFQRIFESAFTDWKCGSIWRRAENTIQVVQYTVDGWKLAVSSWASLSHYLRRGFQRRINVGIPRWCFSTLQLWGAGFLFVKRVRCFLLKHWTDWMRGKWFFHLG